MLLPVPDVDRAKAFYAQATAGSLREGEQHVVGADDGRELRGDRLLVATGRRLAMARS